ncbi:NAD kinase [Bombilactobacillus thymidiniphilus]|uniref:NAD kinase n=1 Tax=Bombilactobacillus thymidiniphilus TaxID=2923363 RepID=A0ABY4PBX4_9LACO|nr:NAD kinase [Bombilactobacillus thymidiniphilus]UQS83278.1 NAD kinase [Bombilactobacillus thymidiniphilus]
MKVWIQNNHKKLSQRIAEELCAKLVQKGVQIAELDPDLVITIGGDGTFLSTFHRFSNRLAKTKFVGIHTGHLGFYTDWKDSEVDDLVDNITHKEPEVTLFPLLDVKLTMENLQSSHFLSLNESVLKRVSQTMRAEVYIDDDKFERFRGDGIAISTPTGSTAYTKSIGGALVDPTIAVMQFNEIAPINNRVYRTVNSPLILPRGQVVTIIPDQQDDYVVTIDNLANANQAVIKAQYQIAQEQLQMATYRPKNFWVRVRNAFLVDGDQ